MLVGIDCVPKLILNMDFCSKSKIYIFIATVLMKLCHCGRY